MKSDQIVERMVKIYVNLKLFHRHHGTLNEKHLEELLLAIKKQLRVYVNICLFFISDTFRKLA